jgi:hypothetical protein
MEAQFIAETSVEFQRTTWPSKYPTVGAVTSQPILTLLQFLFKSYFNDRLCGLVVRVLGYRSGGPGSIPGTTRKEK